VRLHNEGEVRLCFVLFMAGWSEERVLEELTEYRRRVT
jgi:hypothetical protein